MHLYSYLDESGDIGFSKGSSKYFVVACVFTDNPHYLTTKMARLKKRIREAGWKGIQEFKFAQDHDKVKCKVVNEIASLNFEASCIAVDKSSVTAGLRNNPNVLYNYLTVHYPVTDIIANYSPHKITFCVDRRYSKEKIEEFDKYVKQKIIWKANAEYGIEVDDFCVEHATSEGTLILQIGDYLAGSVYKKIRGLPDSYYDVLKPKIKYRHEWGQITW